MKKNKKDLDKHGIISVVQAPDDVKNKTENSTTDNDKQTESEHGIISTVQEPDYVENKKT